MGCNAFTQICTYTGVNKNDDTRKMYLKTCI